MNQAAGFEMLSYASQYLIYVNAAINPVIYGLTNDTFKRAYHQTPMLPCLWKSKVKSMSHIFLQNIIEKHNSLLQANQQNDVFNKKRNESNIWFWIASKHRLGQSVGNSKATITTKIKIISNLADTGNSELNSNAKPTSVAEIQNCLYCHNRFEFRFRFDA